MKAAVFLVACAASLAFFTAQAQTIYKSIGPDGTVVYSDHAPKNAKIEETINYQSLPSSPLPAGAAQQVERAVRQAPPAARNQSAGVTLYTTTWCGYCKRARAYLAQRGISYQDIDVETPAGTAAFGRAGGRGGVPLLVSNGRSLRGFSAAGYDAFFASH